MIDPDATPAERVEAYLARLEADSEPLPCRLPWWERVCDTVKFVGLLSVVWGGVFGILWLAGKVSGRAG